MGCAYVCNACGKENVYHLKCECGVIPHDLCLHCKRFTSTIQECNGSCYYVGCDGCLTRGWCHECIVREMTIEELDAIIQRLIDSTFRQAP